MSKYQIESRQANGVNYSIIYDTVNGKYFAGYDFMGSAEWERFSDDAYVMTTDESYAILSDLEAADETTEPETDQHIRSLQATLDYAYNRRDDEWKALEDIRKNGPEHLLENQYRSYCESQAFLEGVTMAIFASGYTLTIENTETGRSTVCKQ